MKKFIVIEIIVLVLLLVLVGVFMVSELNRSSARTEPTLDIQVLEDSAAPETQSPVVQTAPTEPPETDPPPTEPPETEPPIVVELEDRWIPLLQGKELSAQQYFVYDCNSASFLLTSAEQSQQIFPASITKLFSAYVALQYIAAEQEVIAGSSLNHIDPDSSTAGLQSGDSLTAEEMVAGMLLESGNDATYALASDVGRIIADDPSIDTSTAIERFVEQMNTCAQELGMENSHFVTPDGIHDEEHYIGMKDLTIMAKLAMEDPILSKYVGMATMQVHTGSGRELDWKNSNKLLHDDLDYYCSYATGLKTGYTSAAGNCLISSFRVGDQELLIGVFGCPEQDGRYVDTLLLFAKTFGLEIPQESPAQTDETITDDFGEAA